MWKIVAQYAGSNGKSVHTVERDGIVYRCTCQGFRIFKKGYCKHTRMAQAEAERGPVQGERVLVPRAAKARREEPPKQKSPRSTQRPHQELQKRRIRFEDE